MKTFRYNLNKNYIFTFFFAMTILCIVTLTLALKFEQWFLSSSLAFGMIFCAIHAYVTYKPNMRV